MALVLLRRFDGEQVDLEEMDRDEDAQDFHREATRIRRERRRA
jgi:hypothetical protein